MRSSDNPATLQVIPALNAGGAERTTIDIAHALVRNGFRALVATAGGRMEPLLAAMGVEVVHLPLDSKAPHAILANARHLMTVIQKYNVRLLHVRSRAPAWSALLAARRTGVPLVTTYHGIYNASNPLKRFYNSVMVKGEGIIANSQWTADHIVREHRIPRERISVIHRGVDLEEFDPAGVAPDRVTALRTQWGITAGETLILLPGRLTRWKGQLVLIEALTHLAHEGMLKNVKAVLAGDPQGRNDYLTELQQAIADNELQDVVQIVPHIADIAAAYLLSDIVVSASTDPEAFGRVAAEAGAMQRPVIATDHGGARETVLAKRSGLLVPPADPMAFADALRTLLSMTGEERHQLGETGRAHVRVHFSLERMCTDTIGLYQSLLSAS